MKATRVVLAVLALALATACSGSVVGPEGPVAGGCGVMGSPC